MSQSLPSESPDLERHLLPIKEKGLPGSTGGYGRVGIEISEEFAKKREGQILLWMIVNLCSRMRGVVGQIEINIPSGVKPFDPSIVPLVTNPDLSLAEAVAASASLCARDCEITQTPSDSLQKEKDIVVSIGDMESSRKRAKREIGVSCQRWLALVGSRDWIRSVDASIGQRRDENNPFGAGAAACIAAGDVFKFLRGILPSHGSLAEKVCLSTYRFGSIDFEGLKEASNPPLPEALDIGRVHLVGCGAVGHSFCHSLLPIKQLRGDVTLIDRRTDEFRKRESVDYWNLNRYILATTKDVGRPKAELLKEILVRLKGRMEFTSYDDGFQDYINSKSPRQLLHVLSCVDKNPSRHAIQDQLPRIIYGASTDQMTIQLSVYDLLKDTACLKCYNSGLSPLESDEEIIKQLKSLDQQQRDQLAIEKGVNPSMLSEYISSPNCGVVDGSELRKFSNQGNQLEFSVSFVSAMAGIALAAETCKQSMNNSSKESERLSGVPSTDLYMNFWFNSSSLVTTRARPECWCNQGDPSPRNIFSHIWRASP